MIITDCMMWAKRARNSLIVLGAIMCGTASAQDIPHTQITAQSTLAPWNGFVIEQISDGIFIDCQTRCNGFTTNAKSGVISFKFKQPYDVNSLKLWNDVNIGKEGIAAFHLGFKNTENLMLSSQEFMAVSGRSAAQSFDFPTVENVMQIDLVVLTSLREDTTFAERIEVREVGFTGTPSQERLNLTQALSAAQSENEEKQAAIDNQINLINIQNDLLKDPQKEIDALEAKNLQLQTDNTALQRQIGELETASSSTPPAPSGWNMWKAATFIAGLIAAGLAGVLFLKERQHKMPPRTALKSNIPARAPYPEDAGVIFSHSPLLAGAVTPGAVPLVPAGHMAPAGLQMMTGQFAALKPAYMATGRIGGPQEGVPTNEDVAFGTGFLITPNHVMTNQHVYEFYKHYLTGEDCGGIEFIAERDRDASDYVAFDGAPPVILPELDIAIFKLARAVRNRDPIDRIAIPTEELDEREVVTISYPCPFEVDDMILSVVESDPVFAVKRVSQGRVFRHSTDTDASFGVMVNVDARVNSSEKLSAICHNASTLGGSSGAPLLDMSGQLVGVHFAGDRTFNGKEAANLAMAIEALMHAYPN